MNPNRISDNQRGWLRAATAEGGCYLPLTRTKQSVDDCQTLVIYGLAEYREVPQEGGPGRDGKLQRWTDYYLVATELGRSVIGGGRG